MIDPRKHNYYKKLMDLVVKGELSPGRITEVDVWHDDRCRIYRGGYCDCEPEITVRPGVERN